jgi:DNA-binding NarL/FixJ family response regulator
MDARMPRPDSITATAHLAGPDIANPIPILIATTFDLDEYVFSTLRAGASGFVLKDIEPDDLVAAVRTVAGGPRPHRPWGHPQAHRRVDGERRLAAGGVG